MISIILPTYLGKYKHAAEDRPPKLNRAIRSVLKQKYQDWQLVVVCDGCQMSFDIAKQYQDKRIKIALIDKQPMFSGNIRNTGIDLADGEWITYLDNDDYLGPNHIQLLSDAIDDETDWLFFNDYTLNGEAFKERPCRLKQYQCGTSNIAHRKDIGARWITHNKYGQDDWAFISRLMLESDRMKVCEGEYLVCHIPFRKGFDV